MRLLFSRAQFASTCVASGIDNLLRFTLQWRAPRNNNLARLLEAVGLGLFTIGTIFFLSYFFGECVDVPAWHEQVQSHISCSRMLPIWTLRTEAVF